ncbi:MAG: hypothetical protein ACKOX6_12170 [Bdellovibrio sp.]
MRKMFLMFGALLVSASAFAKVDQNAIITTYKCSNGGSLELLNTRYGNVKKAVFSKEGSLNQAAYVSFWSRNFDKYEGDVFAYMTFPDPNSGEMPERTRAMANMEISTDEQGLVLNLTFVSTDQENLNFSCVNY